MNGTSRTAVLNKHPLVVRSLIFSSKPSHPPPPLPKNELDRVAVYAREAMLIISQNDPPGTGMLSEETKGTLIDLQRLLKINTSVVGT